jgi:hypothetical protein
MGAEDGQKSAGGGVEAGAQTGLPHTFVAYSESDRDWVFGFLIPGLGTPPGGVVTRDSFEPGAPVVSEVDRAISLASVVVVVFSHAFLADEWGLFSEAVASSAEVGGDRGPVVVPILLDSCELPLRIGAKVSLDCRSRETWEPAVARLRDMLAAPSPPAEELPCPYPGMASFGSAQRHLFFGRDAELDELATRAFHQPLLVVLGPSGCGKSSLVCAGLVPRLEDAADHRWVVRVIVPGSAPYAALCQALQASPALSPGETPAAADRLLARRPGATRLLIVVDQAEAVFTQSSAEERTAFDEAVSVLRVASNSCLLLLLRADFFGDLMASELWPLEASERLELASLPRSGLREAIIRPAAASGVHVEPVLVERLLHDCAQEPGALPLLQETMVLLWRRRDRRLLTLAAYEDVAGADGCILATALVMHADAALGSLTSKEQIVARRVLLRLVQLGDGRAHTRLQQPLTALRRSGPDPDEAERVIQHLAQRRIITLGGADEGVEAEASLAHETLIVRWPVLVRWIEQLSVDEARRRRLEHDAQVWVESGRDRAELYRGHRLSESTAWKRRHPGEISDTALRFLAAGRRRRLRSAGTISILTAAVVASLVVLGAPQLEDYMLSREERQEQDRLRGEAIALGRKVQVEGGRLSPRPGIPAEAVPTLFVDVHEVTNAQYHRCDKARACSPPKEDNSYRQYSEGPEEFPVVHVSALDASDYCRWVGGRLPTAGEWLWIAIGRSGGPYPWGNAKRGGSGPPNSKRVASRLVSVSSDQFDAGNTREGVSHLVGNASEWTATIGKFDDSQGRYIFAGHWTGTDQRAPLLFLGAAYDLPPDPPIESTSVAEAEEHLGTLGFRCVSEHDYDEGHSR